MVLAPPGLALLWRRARLETLAFGAMIAGQIALYARYRLWDQTMYGHPFLLSVIVLAAVPAGAALAWALDERSGPDAARDHGSR